MRHLNPRLKDAGQTNEWLDAVPDRPKAELQTKSSHYLNRRQHEAICSRGQIKVLPGSFLSGIPSPCDRQRAPSAWGKSPSSPATQMDGRIIGRWRESKAARIAPDVRLRRNLTFFRSQKRTHAENSNQNTVEE
jgi:hypothetical protein